MTLRLLNSLIVVLVGATIGANGYGCGCCGCCHCQPCCNCFPCTNPPLLIKLPPTPPKLCCCGCCCCRPCCCCPCCCGGGGRKRRSVASLDKKCMKSMKKTASVCTNATRNCKRCANLPKLEQKMPKFNLASANKTDKKPKSRARRQVEALGQMFGNKLGLLPSQRFNFASSKPAMSAGGCCDCKC